MNIFLQLQVHERFEPDESALTVFLIGGKDNLKSARPIEIEHYNIINITNIIIHIKPDI